MANPRSISNAILALAAGCLLACLGACSGGSAPPPPETSASKADKDEDTSNLGGSEKGATEKRTERGSGDDAEEEEEGDKPAAPEEDEPGGAEIGEDDTKEAVVACNEKKKLFDRFSGDDGECSALALAKVNCAKDGVLKVLSAKQKTQFEDSLAGSYKGWLIDQCGDCPPGSDSALCESSTGARQTGTKIFFVKEEDNEIRGKAMVIPTRPGQETDAAEDDTEEEEPEE